MLFPFPFPLPLWLDVAAGGVAGAVLLVGSTGMYVVAAPKVIYVPLGWWTLGGVKWVFRLDMFVPFAPGVKWVFVFLGFWSNLTIMSR